MVLQRVLRHVTIFCEGKRSPSRPIMPIWPIRRPARCRKLFDSTYIYALLSVLFGIHQERVTLQTIGRGYFKPSMLQLPLPLSTGRRLRLVPRSAGDVVGVRVGALPPLAEAVVVAVVVRGEGRAAVEARAPRPATGAAAHARAVGLGRGRRSGRPPARGLARLEAARGGLDASRGVVASNGTKGPQWVGVRARPRRTPTRPGQAH